MAKSGSCALTVFLPALQDKVSLAMSHMDLSNLNSGEYMYAIVGEWGWGVEGKQVGSMDEESQVRGCYNITFICTPTNQETVSVLEKTSKQNI